MNARRLSSRFVIVYCLINSFGKDLQGLLKSATPQAISISHPSGKKKQNKKTLTASLQQHSTDYKSRQNKNKRRFKTSQKAKGAFNK